MPSSTERVIAIDPGERTGYAAGTITDGKLKIERQGVATIKDFALALSKQVEKYDTFVYETWRLYPHMAKRMVGSDFQPVQLVGMIRFIAWLNPRVKLVSQGANVKDIALRTMTPALKRRMAKSSEQHDKDALMHLHYYHWGQTIDDVVD